MKNTRTCPKCHSQDILRLTDQTHANLLPTNFTIFGAVYLTRYVCVDCGFSEQWVDNPPDSNRLRKKHRPEKS